MRTDGLTVKNIDKKQDIYRIFKDYLLNKRKNTNFTVFKLDRYNPNLIGEITIPSSGINGHYAPPGTY